MAPDPSTAAPPVPDAARARGILALLDEGDMDGAIDAGLSRFAPLDALDDGANARLVQARDRLLAAWAARDRYRARAQRLERIAAERRQARAARQGTPRPAASAGAAEAPRPALPAAAAAALARARARAAGNGA